MSTLARSPVFARRSGRPAPAPALAAYTAVVLADSPAVYLPLNETSGTVAHDQSGNGRDVTLNFTPTWGANLLKGTGASIAFHTGSLADASWMESTDITVEAWIKNTVSAYSIIVDRRTASDVWSFEVRGDTTGRLDCLTMGSSDGVNPDGSVDTTAGPAVAVNDNTLHHVVMRVDSQASTASPRTMTLFVDGSTQASGTGAHGLWTNGNCPMYFFAQGAGSRQYTGTIALVAFYPSALSDARVLAHYTAGTT